MSDKFQDKFRIPSARAIWWDYRNDAAYFVTICTVGREHYFGEIMDGEMRLSEIGEIVRANWFEIPQHFSFIRFDAFVVMPNHVHGILVINHLKNEPDRDAINRLSTESPRLGGITGENNPMLSDNLPRVVRWYKGKTTFQCRNIHGDFAWQTRFHDHIIRDEDEYWRIREYIQNNPEKWVEDKYNQPDAL